MTIAVPTVRYGRDNFISLKQHARRTGSRGNNFWGQLQSVHYLSIKQIKQYEKN